MSKRRVGLAELEESHDLLRRQRERAPRGALAALVAGVDVLAAACLDGADEGLRAHAIGPPPTRRSAYAYPASNARRFSSSVPFGTDAAIAVRSASVSARKLGEEKWRK